MFYFWLFWLSRSPIFLFSFVPVLSIVRIQQILYAILMSPSVSECPNFPVNVDEHTNLDEPDLFIYCTPPAWTDW